MNVQIIGLGHAVPEKVLTNQDLEKMVDTTDEWIIQRSGIRERRIADIHTATSDLGVKAAIMALERAHIGPEDLDLIIVATATPDMPFPSTACFVQDKLGAVNAAAFDVSAGCTGFVYGLTVAEKFMHSPQYKYVLVIGSEVISKIIDYTDRGTCVLFGDGAGAAVVSRGSSNYGIISSYLGADGKGAQYICIPAGGTAQPTSFETVKNRLHYLRMNGNEVFKFATKILVEVSDKLITMSGLDYSDIDVFIPHQANMRIIKTALKKLAIPEEKTIINLDKYGNTSAACIPMGLSMAEQEGGLKAGDYVLMVSFGAGLTYGGVLLRWGRD